MNTMNKIYEIFQMKDTVIINTELRTYFRSLLNQDYRILLPVISGHNIIDEDTIRFINEYLSMPEKRPFLKKIKFKLRRIFSS